MRDPDALFASLHAEMVGCIVPVSLRNENGNTKTQQYFTKEIVYGNDSAIYSTVDELTDDPFVASLAGICPFAVCGRLLLDRSFDSVPCPHPGLRNCAGC